MTIRSDQAGSIRSVALLKAGAMTHQIDTDQRYVGLGFSVSGSDIVTTSLAGPAVAPPGHYMLFLVDTAGVPSVSTWVQVG